MTKAIIDVHLDTHRSGHDHSYNGWLFVRTDSHTNTIYTQMIEGRSSLASTGRATMTALNKLISLLTQLGIEVTTDPRVCHTLYEEGRDPIKDPMRLDRIASW